MNEDLMVEQTPDRDLTLGPIGSRVIFENDLVRVWELAVEPGKSKGLHRHDLPYVIVPLTAGEIEIQSIDGHVVCPKEQVGEAIWREAGEIHDLRNLGSTTYRNVLVEIKSQKVSGE
jgi:beta-alanine degradation protein BauB